MLGIAITMLPDEDEHKADLMTLQNELMNAMSIIATPEGREPHRHLSSDLVEYLESQIDLLSTKQNFRFVLPGANAVEAYLQMARSKCRTAERRLWTAHRQYPIDPTILKFFNRLSDYLFVLALHYSDRHRYRTR
jgi:ATP:cob(I)alamin adenosyltransferase